MRLSTTAVYSQGKKNYPETISLHFKKIQETFDEIRKYIDSATQIAIDTMLQDICDDFASCFEDSELFQNGMITFLLNEKTKEYKIHLAVEKSKRHTCDKDLDSFVFLSSEESFDFEDKTHLFCDIFKRHKAAINPADIFESLKSKANIIAIADRSFIIAKIELKIAEISEFEIFKMAKENLSQRFQIKFNEQTHFDLSTLIESSYFK